MNETHVCFVIFYYNRAYMGLFYVILEADLQLMGNENRK